MVSFPLTRAVRCFETGLSSSHLRCLLACSGRQVRSLSVAGAAHGCCNDRVVSILGRCAGLTRQRTRDANIR